MRFAMLLLAILTFGRVAAAQVCCTVPAGATSDCCCGSTLTTPGTYTMRANLTCPGNGITINGPGIAFNGNNKTILSSQACAPAGVKGLTINNGTNTTTVTKVIVDNFYWGIDIANSTGVDLSSVTAQNNTDEGIHFGGGSTGCTLRNSTVQFNGDACLAGSHEDLYLVDGATTGSHTITSVTVHSNAGAATDASVYVKSNNNVFTSLKADTKPVKITSTAAGNCLGKLSSGVCVSSTNTITGTKLIFESSGSSNVAAGVKIAGATGEECVRFQSGAANNTVKTATSNLTVCKDAHNVGQVFADAGTTNTYDRVSAGNACPQVCGTGAVTELPTGCTPVCP